MGMWTHQNWSSYSSQSYIHVVLINTESKYRYRQHPETDPHHGLFFPEARKRYVEELQFHDPEYSPESHELANRSVGKPHAILASAEETRASQPKTQSNLMNNHSEEFVPIDERKWNDVPANDDVTS